MDNCFIHKGIDVRNLIESKRHNLLFLLPYNPQLNPIEELFSNWKGQIKSGNPNTKDDLLALIKCSMTKITSQDCCGYFNYVREFEVKGVRREDF